MPLFGRNAYEVFLPKLVPQNTYWVLISIYSWCELTRVFMYVSLILIAQFYQIRTCITVSKIHTGSPRIVFWYDSWRQIPLSMNFAPAEGQVKMRISFEKITFIFSSEMKDTEFKWWICPSIWLARRRLLRRNPIHLDVTCSENFAIYSDLFWITQFKQLQHESFIMKNQMTRNLFSDFWGVDGARFPSQHFGSPTSIPPSAHAKEIRN